MKILIVFAHPDDETMLTGGTLALLSGAGAELYYLCATRGEGGELGEPPVCSRDEIGLIREKELLCAVEVLGCKSLAFLDYIDPLVGEGDSLFSYTDDFDGAVYKISHHIQKIRPDAVISHGSNGEYGHPGHILTHQAVRKAVENRSEQDLIFYTFCADYPDHPRPRHANKDNPAHLILDVRSAMSKKEKAAYCHRSQHALFARRSSKRAGYRLTIPEVLSTIESLHRVYPQVNGVVDDELAKLLQPVSKNLNC